MTVEFEKLKFTRDWNSSADFPTYEENEQKVRADLQALHDETKEFINEKLIPGIENMAVPGTGDMLADVYDPQGKRTDVYKYVEDKADSVANALGSHSDNENNPHHVTASQVQVSESVVESFKETGDWSVDGVLTQFGSILFGGEPLYRWHKIKTAITEQDSGGISISTAGGFYICYASEIVVNANSTITLVNYSTKQVLSGGSFTIPEGMYFIPANTDTSSTVYRAKSNCVAKLTYIASSYNPSISNYLTVTGTADVELLTSTDPNAYTDGYVDADGYTYTALEPLVAFVPRIASGSYVGTGTYGESNPCSLLFPFVPKMVVIMASWTTIPGEYGYTIIWTGQRGSTSTTANSTGYRNNVATLSGTTLSWYSDVDAKAQLNSGTYYWVAIG